MGETDGAASAVAWLRTGGWDVVRGKLAEAEDGGWADPELGAEALAAAELIAAGRGRPARELPPEAERFLDEVEGWPSDADAARAVDVVLRIRDGGSMLAEDVAAAGRAEAWRRQLDALLVRLRS